MDENKTAVPAVTAPVVLTQAEIDAKVEADKVAAEAAAIAAYEKAIANANLAIVQSQAAYNSARVYQAWGIGAGAVLAGVGILLIGLRK